MDSDFISRREHDEFVKRMEDEHNRINHRLEICEGFAQEMQDMNTNINNLANNMKQMLDAQIKQGDRLEKIENEPKSAWNSIKKGIFNAIGAAIGGGIIAALLYFM